MALVLNSTVSSDLRDDTVQKQLYIELGTSKAGGNLSTSRGYATEGVVLNHPAAERGGNT